MWCQKLYISILCARLEWKRHLWCVFCAQNQKHPAYISWRVTLAVVTQDDSRDGGRLGSVPESPKEEPSGPVTTASPDPPIMWLRSTREYTQLEDVNERRERQGQLDLRAKTHSVVRRRQLLRTGLVTHAKVTGVMTDIVNARYNFDHCFGTWRRCT